MAKTKTISIRVSNTYRGSVINGVFEHETDRNGRWIPSDNIRITTSDTDSTLPVLLEANAVSNLGAQKPELCFVAQTDYRLSKTMELEPNKELGLPSAKAYFYKPIVADLSMEVADSSVSD
jgi:hypothetical protein|tara:strand:- start:27439 stop:27801 length:363 start_codon:yes stop_codon:yes gene_type:complete